MILVAVALLIGSVIYSATRLGPLERQVNEKTVTVQRLQSEINRETTEKDRLNIELADVRNQLQLTQQSIDGLQNQVADLRSAQNDLFNFFSKVTEKEQVKFIDSAVDWNATKSELMNLPSGKRKQSLLAGILLAWKEIPFSMGQQTLNRGFDSPRFIRYVLTISGVDCVDSRRRRQSTITELLLNRNRDDFRGNAGGGRNKVPILFGVLRFYQLPVMLEHQPGVRVS